MKQIEYDYSHVPTIVEFARSNAFIRGLMGPLGSGKSVGCVMEILRRSMEQAPNKDGVRRTRWVVIRNSYPQLRDTTIKTVLDWLPPQHFGEFKKQDSVYFINKFPGVEIEILFRALDRPDQIGNLLSLEVTGAWVNEAREVPPEIIDGLQGRVGRFPSSRDGGCTWFGIIMDTNPPDDDSWWYETFEEKKPDNMAIFKQPSGLSANAENKKNLPQNYYSNLAQGKDQEWVNVYVHGMYGMLKDGRPVYPEFSDDKHVAAEDIRPIPDVGVTLGWDFGITPACVVTQLTSMGDFLILDELVIPDHAGMGIRQFSQEVVKPYLLEHYAAWIDQGLVRSYGDPAGNQRSQTDEITCLMVLNGDYRDDTAAHALGRLGIMTAPASTNSILARLDAVKYFLNNGRFKLSPKCRYLRKGFRGAYQYSRVQMSGSARYTDRPSKNTYSHCFDGEVRVSTPKGQVAIKALRVGDLVKTPFGHKRVTASMNRLTDQRIELTFSNGVRTICTKDHPYKVFGGQVEADVLQYSDVLISIHNTKEVERWARHKSTAFKPLTGSSITKNLKDILRRIISCMVRPDTCIGTYGSITMAPSLRGMWYTMRTEIDRIITFPIYEVCRSPATQPITGENVRRSILKKQGSTCLNIAYPQPYTGIGAQLVGNGINNTPKIHGWGENLNPTTVYNAEESTKFYEEPVRGAFVPRLVKALRDAILEWIISLWHVLYVGRSSSKVGIQKLDPALKNAGKTSYENPRLKNKRSVNGIGRVFDITVEDAHCFFADGILVSNCQDALQYTALMALPFDLQKAPRLSSVDKRLAHLEKGEQDGYETYATRSQQDTMRSLEGDPWGDDVEEYVDDILISTLGED